jgi:hypothetical protein
MLELYDDVRHVRAAPGPDAWTKQLMLILRGEEVTRKLRVELGGLPVPDTDDGRKAANFLDNFARFAFERMLAEERRVRGLPENITLLQSIRSLDRLEFWLLDAFGLMRDAHRTIMTQVPELKEPFEKADACKELAALAID